MEQCEVFGAKHLGSSHGVSVAAVTTCALVAESREHTPFVHAADSVALGDSKPPICHQKGKQVGG